LESGSILQLLRTAKKEILVEQLQLYRFWKDYSVSHSNLFLNELFNAAHRGCSVRILLDPTYIEQSDNDNNNARVVEYINEYATHFGLSDNLEARLAYLQDITGHNMLTKVHNKGIIVDREKAYVGSMNWGVGAPIKNREVGVIIENEDAAYYYKNIFDYDWNLTLNKFIDIDTMYSTNLIFNKLNTTLHSDVAIFNKIILSTIELELNCFLYKTASNMKEISLSVDLNRTRILLRPKQVEKVTIQFSLKEFRQDKQENYYPHIDTINDFSHISFLVELKISGMDMNSSLLWFNIMYQPQIKLNDGANITGNNEEKPLNIRVIDSRYLFVFIITTMILISILRDTVQFKISKKNDKK
jgi:hypothetical protein